jgi:hypothetical protein
LPTTRLFTTATATTTTAALEQPVSDKGMRYEEEEKIAHSFSMLSYSFWFGFFFFVQLSSNETHYCNILHHHFFELLLLSSSTLINSFVLMHFTLSFRFISFSTTTTQLTY